MAMDVFTYAGVLFLGVLIYALSSFVLGSILELLLNDRKRDYYFFLWIAGGATFVALLFIFLF